MPDYLLPVTRFLEKRLFNSRIIRIWCRNIRDWRPKPRYPLTNQICRTMLIAPDDVDDCHPELVDRNLEMD